MSDTTTPQGVSSVRWQEDQYKESQWTYGNWGGKGWSMGQFNKTEATLDRNVVALDELDKVFKAHDIYLLGIQERLKSRPMGAC